MQSIRSFCRKINGLCWDLHYAVSGVPKWIAFKWKIKKLGVDEKYIREAFAYLCELDLDEFAQAGRLQLMAIGNFVHIKHFVPVPEIVGAPNVPDGVAYLVEDPNHKQVYRRVYEFTLTDNAKGQLIAHRYFEIEGVIEVDGYKFNNHWKEIYRSGRLIKDIAFVEYLKELYGDGKLKPKVHD